MSLEGGSLQLVDSGGQLVADVSQRISAGTQLAQVISGIAETTMQQSHDLLVSGGALRGQVACARGAPGSSRGDLLLGGVDGVMERHAHAGAACTRIQSSITLDDAALNPLGLLENTFRGVLKKFRARNQIRQKCSAGIILRDGSHFGLLKTGLRDVPLGLATGLSFKNPSLIRILSKKNHLLGNVKAVLQPRVALAR